MQVRLLPNDKNGSIKPDVKGSVKVLKSDDD